MRLPSLSLAAVLLASAGTVATNCLPSMGQDPSAPANDGAAPTDLDARMQAYVQPYADSNNFSGCVLIARGETVLVRRCWSDANRELGVSNTPKMRFHIASVSKPFTAAAVLALAQDGRLAITDPVLRFVPGFRDGSRLTIHHLLTHTSGIPNVNNFPDYERNSRFPWTLPQIVSWFSEKPLESEPGSRYRYSNSNYNLLALIVEKVSGQPFGDALRRLVLGPAGLSDTGHDGSPASVLPARAAGYVPVGLDGIENAPFLDWSIKTGNGSLYSTIDDLHRWVRALRAGRVISQGWLDKMFTDQGEGVGYGWFVRRSGSRPVFASNGRSPGYSASLDYFPASDVVVAVVANLYSSITQTMGEDLGAVAHGETRRALVPARRVVVPAEELATFAGTWQFGQDFSYNPGFVATVRPADGSLAMSGTGGMGTTFLIPLGGARFLDRAYGGTVTFAVGRAGQADTLTWNVGQDFRAVRVDR